MGHLVAFDACVLWVNLLIQAMSRKIQDILEMWASIPTSVWIAYVLVFAVILYMILSKYYSEAWRSHREMKKKRRLQQEQAFGDMVVEDLLSLQQRGILDAKEVNKMLKRIGNCLNMGDILPKWVERNRKSQSDLKAELKAKHKGDTPIIAPVKTIPDKPKTKKEAVRGILSKAVVARAM